MTIRNRVFYLSLIALLTAPAWADGAHAAASSEPCVILKRMGPADEVTSHLYSFGIRGKQFQAADAAATLTG